MESAQGRQTGARDEPGAQPHQEQQYRQCNQGGADKATEQLAVTTPVQRKVVTHCFAIGHWSDTLNRNEPGATGAAPAGKGQIKDRFAIERHHGLLGGR